MSAPRSVDTSTSAPLPPLSGRGLLRWMWRQLTSMRTALILLFCLAVASIPGSVFPQRGVNPILVKQWIADAPVTGPVLDRLGFFDVYGSPWFAAIYLLLFVSLIGCVVPRLGTFIRSIMRKPPAAPARMQVLPAFETFAASEDAAEVIRRATERLRDERWRVRGGQTQDVPWVSAEKGYLREAGNLVFHLSLVVLLIAVAVGGLLGWRGSVIVRVGEGFTNTLTQYDAFNPGRLASATSLQPFGFRLDAFDVDFERGVAQRGAPRVFQAHIRYRPNPSAPFEDTTIEVNRPLQAQDAKVTLVGHGYAPMFTVRDSAGSVVFDDAVVFLPQDGNFTSTGVVKVPDAARQLGFQGIFLPTAAVDAERGPHSTFPAPDDPQVFLSAWLGDLGLDDGPPQSVYRLDVSRMRQLGLERLSPGATWNLPEGAGSITFRGFQRWASFQVAHDPGRPAALAAALLAIAGVTLTLLVRRRRLWVKALPTSSGSRVEIAGLARSESADVGADVVRIGALLAGSAVVRASEPGAGEGRTTDDAR